MRYLGSLLLAALLFPASVRAGDLSPSGPPAPTMHSLKEIYEQISQANQALGNGSAFLLFPHVVEQQGTITNTQNTFDTRLYIVATGPCIGQNLKDGAPFSSGYGATVSVDLYLYDESGQPAKSATATNVAFPATYTLGAGVAKVNVTLDNLFQIAGGFASPTFSGYAVLRVGSGNLNDIAVQAFTLNSHANAFDLSITSLTPTVIQEDASAKSAPAKDKK